MLETFYDLFGGIGGFRLALETNGFKCVGSCEIDKYAREIYRKNFGEYPSEMDATKIKPEELPDFDLLCAGFPCQAFSIAGKRLGFEESRGTLFFEIARIARQKRPRFLLLENVKGLLSHDNGKTFAEILATLDEIGYDAEWQVLNSKYFVPQNRERIFIVGHLRGECAREIFPFSEDVKKTDGNESNLKRIEGNPNVYNTDAQAGKIYDPKGISPTVSGQRINSQGFIITEPKLKQLNNPKHSTNRVYGTNGIARALKSNTGAKTGLYVVESKIKSLGSMPISFIRRRNKPNQSKICKFLNENKTTSLIKLSKLTGITKTQIEHYFRNDSSGALPDKDDWLKLKEIMKFDETYDTIMTDYVEDYMTHEMATRVHDSTGLSPTLTGGEKLIAVVNDRGKLREVKNSSNLDANYWKGIDNHAARTMIKVRSSTQKHATVMEDKSPALTETMGKGGGNVPMIESDKIRRLTPLECERLQGFPEGWTEGISDTQRYRCLGNAVTVPVVQYIAKHLK